jgi:Zn-dependent peptidase ImmA (M78 family)
MRKPYARAIDKRATELLRRFNVFKAPIDVEVVAKRLGAELVFDEMEDDVSGFLLREKNVATIAVNKLHHPNRQRFTIAHECGHLYLHGDRGDRLWLDKAYFFRDASSSGGDRLAEIQANQFAAGLLMPEELVENSIQDENKVSDLDIFRLAMWFGVSEQAMTLRLVSLGILEPGSEKG